MKRVIVISVKSVCMSVYVCLFYKKKNRKNENRQLFCKLQVLPSWTRQQMKMDNEMESIGDERKIDRIAFRKLYLFHKDQFNYGLYFSILSGRNALTPLTKTD